MRFSAWLILFAGLFTGCTTGPSINPKGLKGIVMDDLQGERKGPWLEASTADVRHLGPGILQDNDAHKGEVSIVYTPEIPETGYYNIVLLSPPDENRARNVPVTIIVQGSARLNLMVDQRNKTDKGFATLGTFWLPKGKLTTVTVSNSNTVGCVVVDGIQFVPVKGRSSAFGRQKK